LDDLRVISAIVDAALIAGTLKKATNTDVCTKVAERNVDLVLHVGEKGRSFSARTRPS
jgi:hypothetical protein